ncbi:hypothetical protein ASPFODRAFT_48198 [Aspergillus luchuensis CBS 106.47]|uniref:Uncharacterized protein n=1 Tax=Aspergillus luchuensis (strain CBS 106.47) TaxID=1137211 RepID=A0A1M3TBT8_ASPLC|nr:hypothetical protein ASPFODRAFT_48198 [Aspergillus luchuensis CBS 106.47]
MTRALFRPLRPRGSRIAQTRFILLILSYLSLAKAFLGRSFPFSPPKTVKACLYVNSARIAKVAARRSTEDTIRRRLGVVPAGNRRLTWCFARGVKWEMFIADRTLDGELPTTNGQVHNIYQIDA